MREGNISRVVCVMFNDALRGKGQQQAMLRGRLSILACKVVSRPYGAIHGFRARYTLACAWRLPRGRDQGRAHCRLPRPPRESSLSGWRRARRGRGIRRTYPRQAPGSRPKTQTARGSSLPRWPRRRTCLERASKSTSTASPIPPRAGSPRRELLATGSRSWRRWQYIICCLMPTVAAKLVLRSDECCAQVEASCLDDGPLALQYECS